MKNQYINKYKKLINKKCKADWEIKEWIRVSPDKISLLIDLKNEKHKNLIVQIMANKKTYKLYKKIKEANSPYHLKPIKLETCNGFSISYFNREIGLKELLISGMDLSDIYKLMSDLILAIDSLDKLSYCHLDISPDNIYRSKNDTYILGDFSDLENKSIKMTNPFSSPEILSGENLNFTNDLYSLGILLICLLNKASIPKGLKNIYINIFHDQIYLDDLCHVKKFLLSDKEINSIYCFKYFNHDFDALKALIKKLISLDEKYKFESCLEAKKALDKAFAPLIKECEYKLVCPQSNEDLLDVRTSLIKSPLNKLQFAGKKRSHPGLRSNLRNEKNIAKNTITPKNNNPAKSTVSKKAKTKSNIKTNKKSNKSTIKNNNSRQKSNWSFRKKEGPKASFKDSFSLYFKNALKKENLLKSGLALAILVLFISGLAMEKTNRAQKKKAYADLKTSKAKNYLNQNLQENKLKAEELPTYLSYQSEDPDAAAKTLDISHNSINSLTQAMDWSMDFEDILYIYGEDNELSDLSELSSFKNIIELYISENNFTSFDDISPSENLKILICSDNDFKEGPKAESFPNLQILDLSGNKNLSNIESLKDFSKLKYLILSDTNTKKEDIEELKNTLKDTNIIY